MIKGEVPSPSPEKVYRDESLKLRVCTCIVVILSRVDGIKVNVHGVIKAARPGAVSGVVTSTSRVVTKLQAPSMLVSALLVACLDSQNQGCRMCPQTLR
jgi:hypothetical protein